MFENFPYTDMHQLNLDWIIKIAKDFLDQYTHIQELISNGIISINNETQTGLQEIQDKYTTINNLLNTWYETHSNDIANQLASALVAMQTALSNNINSFNTAADTKAAETLESIPDDYTALSNMVLNIRDNQMINGKVRFRYNLLPTITKNGTTLTVTCPNDSIVLSYISSDTTYRIWQYKNAYTDPITVPDGSLLVYDLDTSAFEVITGSSASLTNKKYIVCFSNVIGYPVGDWEIYVQYLYIREQLRLNCLWGDVYFRYGTRPRITKNGTNIVVYIPDTTAVIDYPSSETTYRIWQYKTVTTGNITVPDGAALIFDIDNSQFVVKSGTSYNITGNYIRCFINALGYVHGPWERYLVQEALEKFPEYYNSYIAGQIGTINSNLAEAPNGDSFVFITDIHTDGNANNSPALIDEILEKTSIDKVILNGDYIQQEETKAAALSKINSVINNYVYPEVTTLRIVGNHEYNTNGSLPNAPELTWQELYYPIIKPNENEIIRQENGLGYVFYNHAQKIKYMVGTYNKAAGMDLASIRFLHNHITDTPAGYTLVFVNHGGLSSNGGYQSGMDQLVDLCDAIRNKTTYTWAYNTFDFTNADYTVACFILGHLHKDYYRLSSSGMPIIVTTCDAYQYNEDPDVNRNLYGLSEQAFDVFTINTTAKTIKTVRIGGGASRSFTY